MKKLMSVLLCLVIVLSLLAGCSKTPPDSGKPDGNTTGADGAGNDAPDASGERKTITMWFWGASDYQREAMDQYLIEGFNSSQDQYTLSVEYRASVDNDIAVAVRRRGTRYCLRFRPGFRRRLRRRGAVPKPGQLLPAVRLEGPPGRRLLRPVLY